MAPQPHGPAQVWLDHRFNWFIAQPRWKRIPLGMLLLPIVLLCALLLTAAVFIILTCDRPLPRRRVD